MFTRSTITVLLAALFAGLGLWASQHYFAAATTPTAPAAAVPPALATVRLFPQPRELPAFSLQQADGTALDNAELRGHWTLVFLGFTHCPDVCPTTLSELATAQKQWASLPAAARPRVLFVSVDPERDSPERTGEYAHFFHPDTLAATVGEPALQAFATGLGLVYMKVPMKGSDYSMDHSTAIVVLDPQGRQAGLIRPPLQPADIARDLIALTQARP